MKNPVVAIVPCSSYRREDIDTAVLRVFSLLGGVNKFIHDGDEVFLKPNILRSALPEYAITTHPEVVGAVARLAIAAGGQVSAGDSPAFHVSKKSVSAIYKACGIAQAVEESGGRMEPGLSSQNVEGGQYLKRFKALESVLRADKIVNIAKAKTHSFAGYTGAVKNMFGVIPGPVKGEMHFKHSDAMQFAHAMIDICEAVPCALHIVDGVIGMEGPGPSAGNPRKLGVLIAGINPYAVDRVAVELMGLRTSGIPQLRCAKKRGLVGGLEDIEIVGASLQECAAEPAFKSAVAGLNPIEQVLSKVLPKKMRLKMKKKPWVQAHCVGCGICAKGCPPEAIIIKDNKAMIDYDGCIRCFCCQELCPEKAVVLKRVVNK